MNQPDTCGSSLHCILALLILIALAAAVGGTIAIAVEILLWIGGQM